ncbi:delta-12 fatty acid desaturase protein [Flagelloscypha sp. PMI_526]|nr:delta-12 fatty acid desaturase protein [Flagelloscypha sp. PMI_526]
MASVTKETKETTVEQGVYVVPDFTIKELLSIIPSHCFKRSALKSSSYILWDLTVIAAVYKTASYADAYVTSGNIDFPHPLLLPAARVAIWALYGFWAGLFATGLWVIAHECGHQAFSESKTINNTVGWILHSGLGVPYHSWRITHGKHHASTSHLTQDQVFVPKTRSELGLPAFNENGEDKHGSRVSDQVKKELVEALGDSPIGATIGFATYLLVGWQMYLIRNASGQKYKGVTNHFNPNAAMFAPHQFNQIILSDIGIFLWLAAIVASIQYWGFSTWFIVYGVPYIWVHHWLVCITFLQHTDPILPHYRASQHNFVRGALCTLDRNLLGDLGSIMGWIGAHATHGISETHILHHVSSKIPHYNAWEASDALRKKLQDCGHEVDGNPVGWAEMYRVFKACRFIEDTGDVVFSKNAQGLAAMRPVFNEYHASDSGIDVNEK